MTLKAVLFLFMVIGWLIIGSYLFNHVNPYLGIVFFGLAGWFLWTSGSKYFIGDN